jgi:ABC-2 type transport system permease protein/oleandomycin transport system permease protein
VTDLIIGGTPAPAPYRRMTPAVAARDIGGVAKRNLLRILRTPQLLLISAVQPALMLILFRYVLGGAIHIPGRSYVDFIVPAVFLEALLIGGVGTAIGLAEDTRSGILDRLRSLPMARSAVLAGRTLGDTARNIVSLALMVGLGLLVGFRFHAPIPSIIAGMGVAIVFGYAICWMNAYIGLSTRDPETAQVAGILPFFVLMFASSAVVPVATLPGWLQGFARNQPFSVTLEALRGLLEGGPVYHWLWQSLVWSGGLFLLFLVLSLRTYRHATG